MSMKKKNTAKKKLAAVGAVVAAGLTPGVITGAPVCSPQPGAGITAAEVVAIDGQEYSFDELYAKQHPDSVDSPVKLLNVADVSRYGASYPSTTPLKVLARRKVEIAYRHVDQMPTFPGGEAALKEYIESHIQYPPKAIKKKVQGCVVVEFIVKATGKIEATKVVQSVDKELDEEAVRVVKSLPNFIPARKDGKAVQAWHTLSVTFTLPEGSDN